VQRAQSDSSPSGGARLGCVTATATTALTFDDLGSSTFLDFSTLAASDTLG